MQEMIYRRKSVRSYTDAPIEENVINEIMVFIEKAKPLYPEIRIKVSVKERDEIKCVLPLKWIPKQCIVIYSEDKPNAYENVGFVFQQLDLYLQSRGIGSCWLGLGRVKNAENNENGMKFIIMLAIGYPKENFRASLQEFKRKVLDEISDMADARLEPARLAPSAVNSQPWYFVHGKDVIHAYCAHNKMLRNMNKIDVGIALAHLYVANPHTFSFCKMENAEEIKGHYYMGSFTI